MNESEKPVEGVEADRERSKARDERLNAQGAVGVTWRNQFARVWEATDEKD